MVLKLSVLVLRPSNWVLLNSYSATIFAWESNICYFFGFKTSSFSPTTFELAFWTVFFGTTSVKGCYSKGPVTGGRGALCWLLNNFQRIFYFRAISFFKKGKTGPPLDLSSVSSLLAQILSLMVRHVHLWTPTMVYIKEKFSFKR